MQVIESEWFPVDSILVTFDVESLYPNIPIQEGLLALKDMLTHSIVHFLVSAVELIL